nr:MAG TPA: hypothetical protein [Caudoviricetes sp.]
MLLVIIYHKYRNCQLLHLKTIPAQCMRLSAAAGTMAFTAVRSALIRPLRRPIRTRTLARLSLVNHLRREGGIYD